MSGNIDRNPCTLLVSLGVNQEQRKVLPSDVDVARSKARFFVREGWSSELAYPEETKKPKETGGYEQSVSVVRGTASLQTEHLENHQRNWGPRCPDPYRLGSGGTSHAESRQR